MPFLDWVNKNQAKKQAGEVPYRLLEFRTGYGDTSAASENLLIQGDNLEALKALIPFYAGRVKCVYIDPPFNTQDAFEHYDDKLEHSQWLSLMYPRLQLIHQLVSDDGSLWLSIDDNELAYLMVLADEVFGRKNRMFVATFKQSSASGPKAINPGVVTTCNYIVCYAKSKANWKYYRVFTSRDRDPRYSRVIENPEAPYSEWKLTTLSEDFAKSLGCANQREAKKQLGDDHEVRLHDYAIKNANHVVRTARVAPKDVNETARAALESSKENPGTVFRSERQGLDDQYFLNGEQLIFYRNKVRNIDGLETTAEPLTNLWTDLLSNNLHNEGGVDFPNGKKPESLVQRILDVSTKPGDCVLDSFLGSGTTAAVAHKMRRNYIGIELGDHARTHCVPRLNRVIEGEQEGISKAVDWKGGGGFRFYTLGDTVFLADGGINPNVRFKALAGYVWHFETGKPAGMDFKSPFLGEHEGTAYYLLFNGILGDKRPQGGNVLTQTVLAELERISGTQRAHEGGRVIYGEKTLLSERRLAAENIVFKQIPYDIKAR